jgi:hypothetical protein
LAEGGLEKAEKADVVGWVDVARDGRLEEARQQDGLHPAAGEGGLGDYALNILLNGRMGEKGRGGGVNGKKESSCQGLWLLGFLANLSKARGEWEG